MKASLCIVAFHFYLKETGGVCVQASLREPEIISNSNPGVSKRLYAEKIKVKLISQKTELSVLFSFLKGGVKEL